MKWLIGNGRNILFWEDCWLGEKPLITSPSLRRIEVATKNFFGERVSDYFSNNTWKIMEDCCFDQPHLLLATRELQILLAITFLPLFPRDDKFIWKGDPLGEYSVKMTYNSLLQELALTINWKGVWNPQLIPKINFLWWIVLHNKILTQDNLAKWGFQFPNRCILCKNEAEIPSHLFL
ncbi:hypothetical protein SUGI_0822340 [Cryptomeria japonica]|nr:hypothetical protein SUGI_0822340 [Cryptomeria japonica]